MYSEILEYIGFVHPVFKNISDNSTIIPCSAETELMLRKATKSGLIQYVSGGNDFQGKDDKKLSVDSFANHF